MISVAVAGEYDEYLLSREVRKVRELLNGSVQAPLVKDGQLVNWNICACVNDEHNSFERDQIDPLILVGRVFENHEDKWQTHVSPRHSDYDRIKSCETLCHELYAYSCRIYPYHNVAFLQQDPWFLPPRQVRKALHSLNYTVLSCPSIDFINIKKNPAFLLHHSLNASDISDDEHSILRIQRSRRTKQKAFDPRAERLLEDLFSHVHAPTEARYTFVGYEVLDDFGENYTDWEQDVLKQEPLLLKHLTASDVREGALEELCKSLPSECAVGIRSTVCVGSECYHLPLLDLYLIGRFFPSRKELPINGMFVQSSRSSRHFYGYDLMKEDDWKHFMYQREHLSAPVVSLPFLKFAHAQGYSLLRLTPSSARLSQPVAFSHHSTSPWNYGIRIEETYHRKLRSDDIELEESKDALEKTNDLRLSI